MPPFVARGQSRFDSCAAYSLQESITAFASVPSKKRLSAAYHQMTPATESYTPGYTQNASDFMAQRTAQNHAAFLLPHLRDSARVLDCGCGPGSVSCDLAKIVASGHVTGIDREASQIERARSHAASRRLANTTFEVGSIYELPFPDSSFDVVFAHALFEHLSSPATALAEVRRVLSPGGLVALRSPDWGGFIVGPD